MITKKTVQFDALPHYFVEYYYDGAELMSRYLYEKKQVLTRVFYTDLPSAEQVLLTEAEAAGGQDVTEAFAALIEQERPLMVTPFSQGAFGEQYELVHAAHVFGEWQFGVKQKNSTLYLLLKVDAITKAVTSPAWDESEYPAHLAFMYQMVKDEQEVAYLRLGEHFLLMGYKEGAYLYLYHFKAGGELECIALKENGPVNMEALSDEEREAMQETIVTVAKKMEQALQKGD